MKWIKNMQVFARSNLEWHYLGKNDFCNGILDAVKISSPFSSRLQNGKSRMLNDTAMVESRRFARGVPNDPHLDREFLARLWVLDKKLQRERQKRKRKNASRRNGYELGSGAQTSVKVPFGRWFSGAPVTGDKSHDEGRPIFRQPPVSQSIAGYLAPATPEEAQVAPLLARSNLLVTRDIEWANLMFGFEQENRYAIVDVCYPQSPVGFIREQSNIISRQLLRSRRPFIASVTDGMGNELFHVRRPFWWITSSIYAEINGKEVGVVHRRWHLWKRIYDLYLGLGGRDFQLPRLGDTHGGGRRCTYEKTLFDNEKKQFAVVENPGFWNWTFTLKDIDGEVLAQIDRDWRGFGFEIFTDAGQYVIRFGTSDPDSKTGPATAIQDLEVVRPLTLSERAVSLALAISLDNDYFSRHGGWGIPFVVVGE